MRLRQLDREYQQCVAKEPKGLEAKLEAIAHKDLDMVRTRGLGEANADVEMEDETQANYLIPNEPSEEESKNTDKVHQ